MDNITDIVIKFDIFRKTLNIKIGEENFDISDKIPMDVWLIGGDTFPKTLTDDWRIRKKLCIITRKFLKNFDKSIDLKQIVF